jgi:hypothetical protein
MLALPFNPYRAHMSVLAIVTWLWIITILLFVPPAFIKDVGIPDSYGLFFIPYSLALLWTLWSLSGRWKLSLLWMGILSLMTWLHVRGFLTVITLILLISFGLVWGYYWHVSHTSSES